MSRRHLPTISAMQCFETAARHLSFTRAAEELSLTQSAVSKQVAQLESVLEHLCSDASANDCKSLQKAPCT